MKFEKDYGVFRICVTTPDQDKVSGFIQIRSRVVNRIINPFIDNMEFRFGVNRYNASRFIRKIFSVGSGNTISRYSFEICKKDGDLFLHIDLASIRIENTHNCVFNAFFRLNRISDPDDAQKIMNDIYDIAERLDNIIFRIENDAIRDIIFFKGWRIELDEI